MRNARAIERREPGGVGRRFIARTQPSLEAQLCNVADGIAYVKAAVDAGLDVDAFAPRLSFFWAIGMNFFMEIAKMRAARLLWCRIMKGFDAKSPKSLMLRTHCQTSGWSLTAQDVFNNVARTCVEAMAATQGHTQSLHTNALDEAIALPTEFSARIARNTQLILQEESHVTHTADPLAGSFYVEWLTDQLAARAWALIQEVEQLGGMTKAIEQGLPKLRIEEAAARTQARIDSGRQPLIGVNKYQLTEEEQIEVLKVENSKVRAEQLEKLVRLRAERIEAMAAELYLAAETDLATVLGQVAALQPQVLVVDSVQTLASPQVEGSAGGVTQVREVAAAVIQVAKQRAMSVLLVGHVTKDGSIAGPRILEHLVDVVTAFEGDRHSRLRLARAVKNRFGPTDEVGCFEQRDNGIHQVTDPSGIFWHQRQGDVTGSAVLVTMDGKRALVGEVQALANATEMHNPRRAVSGLDGARVAMILAVLQARLTMGALAKAEVYASTVGGMRVTEPAADLAIAMAVASVQEGKAIPFHTVVIGEVGLAGEVRPVSALGRRVAEAHRLGFRHAVIPAARADREDLPAGIRITRVTNLGEALNACLFDNPPTTF